MAIDARWRPEVRTAEPLRHECRGLDMTAPGSDKRPTAKMVRLYHDLVGRWGEPTDLFIFDGRELDRPLHVDLVHVPTWADDEECEATTLNTLGMSDWQMKGAAYFTELHLACRELLEPAQRLDLARLLANVTE